MGEKGIEMEQHRAQDKETILPWFFQPYVKSLLRSFPEDLSTRNTGRGMVLGHQRVRLKETKAQLTTTLAKQMKT